MDCSGIEEVVSRAGEARTCSNLCFAPLLPTHCCFLFFCSATIKSST